MYLAVATLLFVVCRLALQLGHPNPLYLAWQAFDDNLWIEGWCRWDALWYRAIAHSGYWFVEGEQSSVAFFPMYPMIVAGLAKLTALRTLRLAVVVTLIAGLSATVLFDRWCARSLDDRARTLSTVTLLLYPFSFFLYGAGYSDALFLALALGSFVLLENDKPHWAGVIAALATATRPVGIALIAGLIIRMVERRGFFEPGFLLKKVRAKDLGVLLSPLGLIGYSLYLWYSFGDPLAFAQAQSGWGQAPGLKTWLKFELFDLFFNKPWSLFHLMIFFHAACTLGAIALIPRVKRRFGWGYAAYVAVAIVVPALSSKDFMGLGRYLIAAFPLFAVAGEALAKTPRLRRVVHGASAALMIWLTSLFALWEYVS